MNQALANKLGKLRSLLGTGEYKNANRILIGYHESAQYTYWAQRILAQLDYGIRVSEKVDGKYDQLLDDVMTELTAQVQDSRAITMEQAKAAEDKLRPMEADAKAYTMLMIAHAHIDMNWQWSYDETVAVTLDTFRTMLQLMDEYPDFTFSQSQGSVYRIVEEFDPDMLAKIRQRVHEGRWEIAASTWVEADKNMPSGESMARHLLYTKNYLSQLLDVPVDTLSLDFEPDTFGHSRNVPEILTQGGVKFYYHCRGYGGEQLYRWRAPSGSEIIAFREPFWYLGSIEPDMAQSVPDICRQRGMDCVMKVYGVGDHGGGPTRRDISRILDMQTWPVYPRLKFSTYKEFYTAAEKAKDNLPVVEQELNFVFTGCYTTQSRIKLANRLGEAGLTEGEALAALGHVMSGIRYPGDSFRSGWRHLLFNQFHDILTGSGVIETREYAMGGFQQLMATSNVCKTNAMRAIADMVDTSAFDTGEDISDTISEGAGVGYDWHHFKIQAADRGAGMTRVFHVFNPTPYTRKEMTELTMWNWQGSKKRLRVRDAEGNVIPVQLLTDDAKGYSGHLYFTLLIPAEVPGMGYTTYIVDQDENYDMDYPYFNDHRTHHADEYVLENEYIRAEVDPVTGGLVSLFDKVKEQEMIDPLRPACFRYIEEATDKGMTSWIVGRYKQVIELLDSPEIAWVKYGEGDLRRSVKVTHRFGAVGSTVSAVISLDAGAKALTYDVNVEFNELGRPNTCIPQLNFSLPLGYAAESYRYDIPVGFLDRAELDMDVPATSYGCALPYGGGSALMLTSNCKYGFRGIEDSLNLTLIRGAYDPDPNPERGNHTMRIAIALADDTSPAALGTMAYNLSNPLCFISLRPHKGTLPLTRSMMQFTGNAMLSSVKLSDDGKALIARVYDVTGADQDISLSFLADVKAACLADTLERPTADAAFQGSTVTFPLKAWSMQTVRIEF